jgi:myo-inositol-1(or 4)-monophosphatase
MKIWDCAPFPPILREAGGYFGDWQGHETVDGGEGLATSRALQAEVVRLLNEEK